VIIILPINNMNKFPIQISTLIINYLLKSPKFISSLQQLLKPTCTKIAIKLCQIFHIRDKAPLPFHGLSCCSFCIYLPFARDLFHIYQRLWQIILLTFAQNFSDAMGGFIEGSWGADRL